MNFAKFWAFGRSGNFTSWRWSNTSPEEAQRAATLAAQHLAAQFAQRGRILERYGYPDRPFREPVLRELHSASGELSAVVTRNSYGCQVLNTARAMFVDVDFPEPSAASKKLGIFASLFGRKLTPEELTQAVITKADDWARSQSSWNWRIYRTPAGVRLLATHALFNPTDRLTQAVFDAVGADPLYRKLCQTQECFRARLTPKPWRCDVPNPPARWPFFTPSDEHAFAAWEATYQSASRNKASCQLLRPGQGHTHPDVQPLITLHDDITRATTPLPLA